LDRFVDGIGDPADFVVYFAEHPQDAEASDIARTWRAERDRLFAALRRRFDLVEEAPRRAGLSRIERFTLRPRGDTP
jgi:hypothetical protein